MCNVFQDFSDLDVPHQKVDSVIVGLAPSKFNHEYLSAAFRIIKERKAPLIAINKARYFASKDGLKLGTGKGLHMYWISRFEALRSRIFQLFSFYYYFRKHLFKVVLSLDWSTRQM